MIASVSVLVEILKKRDDVTVRIETGTWPSGLSKCVAHIDAQISLTEITGMRIEKLWELEIYESERFDGTRSHFESRLYLPDEYCIEGGSQ